MSALKPRSYTGEADLQVMIALTRALRAGGQTVYPIAADLYEELADAGVPASARLWEDPRAGLVGFAYVSQWQNLVDVFDERVCSPALEAEVVAWAVGAMQRRNREQGNPQTLDASTLETDQSRLAFPERHGFLRQAESSIRMRRPLDQPIPDPVLPQGFTIRPMAGEAEIEAYVALHRAAFGTGNMSIQYRRTIMSAPDFIPALDLVAVAANGDLAALCVPGLYRRQPPRGWQERRLDRPGDHPPSLPAPRPGEGAHAARDAPVEEARNRHCHPGDKQSEHGHAAYG